MTALIENVKKFFTDDEWYFVEMDAKSMLQLNYQGKNSRWTCYAQTNEDQQLFFFYSVCPINIPEDKRAQVAEFITRANYGLRIGNFELDYSDGEVRYKTSLDVENAELTSALISNQVYANLWTMDRYLPGVFSVVYGNALPEDAIKEIEG